MPATVLQAAVGAGKTEAALDRLMATLGQRPFVRVWVLLATRRQEVAFRQRLADFHRQRSVFFNVEFFNFYELYERLLNLAAEPQRRIHDSARVALFRHIAHQLIDAQKLPLFGHIAANSGFLRVVADLITELKQNQVYPEMFAAALPSQPNKDHELYAFYDRYQSILQAQALVDREGEGWLALETLHYHPEVARDVDLLIVDGYDQFTPVQALLLAELGKRINDVAITLTLIEDDARQRTIGRRFTRAMQRLADAHGQIDAPLLNESVTFVPSRPPSLQTLIENIFDDSASPYTPVAEDMSLQLIEAPEPAEETSAILREVKKRLLAGERPDEMIIALRDWGRYHKHFETYGRLYQIPLLLHYNEALSANPAIAALLKLLDLAEGATHEKGFRRRDVLEVLRSPYFAVAGMTIEAVNRLDEISLRQKIMGGRENWLQAIDDAAKSYDDEEGTPIEALLTQAEANDLSLSLQDFFDHITPKSARPLREYVEWLDQLIGSDKLNDDLDDPENAHPNHPYTLNMPAQVRGSGVADYIQSRDSGALNALKDILRGFIQGDELLRTIGASQTTLEWDVFYGDLKTAINSASVPQRTPLRSGRVLVTTATDARGLPHSHVFIAGLSEGIFPMPVSEDPLYLDTERQRLQDAGVLLETQAERAADDGLFYELLCLARETLTLSRPTVKEGKEWVESHLWRMVKAVFTPQTIPLQRLRIGAVTPPAEVAARDEALLAVADGLDEAKPNAAVLALYRWLAQDGEQWAQVAHGQALESARMARLPHDVYSGKLQHPESLEISEIELDDNRRWSATQLNDYGACGFRFFAKRLLKLEAQEEPEEGLDALQLGLLYHEILEKTYGIFAAQKIAITPDEQDFALETLAEEAAQVFETAPQDYGLRVSAQWDREKVMLLRRLQALVKLDFSEDAPLNKFGTPRQTIFTEERFSLRIPLADNAIRSIWVNGSIDRIDRVGNRLMVLDYKTGSTKIETKEMIEGRNFQMAVYLLALHELIQKRQSEPAWQKLQVGGGAFWHIRDRKTSGLLQLYNDTEAFVQPVDEHEAIRQAQQHIVRYIQQGRTGIFTVNPSQPDDASGKCSKYCEFYQLCRVSITHKYKQAF